MRDALTTALEAVGATLVAVGLGIAWLPAGLISAGAMLIFAGWAASR